MQGPLSATSEHSGESAVYDGSIFQKNQREPSLATPYGDTLSFDFEF